jgi:hypothetical protein
MNSEAFPITEEMAWREIRQGTYRVDLWEQAVVQSQGDPEQARQAYVTLRTRAICHEMSHFLASHIRQALAEDTQWPPDFKSARDLGRRS